MTTPQNLQPVRRRKQKSRAPQIRHWLQFIMPHVDRYGRLPRGGQKIYLNKLSYQSNGTSVSTLRRYLAAAQYLESRGIDSFGPDVEVMPVASVEAIMRIDKIDPPRAQILMSRLLQGKCTARQLQKEYKALAQIGTRPKYGAHKVGKEELLAIIAHMIGIHGESAEPNITLHDFEFSPFPSGLFDRLAYPRAIAEFKGARVAVFCESEAAWKVSPDRTKRAFMHNIAMALTLYNRVLVFCVSLKHELMDWHSAMDAHCHARMHIESGILDYPKEVFGSGENE